MKEKVEKEEKAEESDSFFDIDGPATPSYVIKDDAKEPVLDSEMKENKKRRLLYQALYRYMKDKFAQGFLKHRELYQLLDSIKNNIKEYILYFPPEIVKRTTACPFLNQRPKHGEIFIVDTAICSEWKRDKHVYRRYGKENNILERDDVYSIEGKEVIICSYTQGVRKPTILLRNKPNQDTLTPENFKRRAYYLISHPRYVLI